MAPFGFGSLVAPFEVCSHKPTLIYRCKLVNNHSCLLGISTFLLLIFVFSAGSVLTHIYLLFCSTKSLENFQEVMLYWLFAGCIFTRFHRWINSEVIKSIYQGSKLITDYLAHSVIIVSGQQRIWKQNLHHAGQVEMSHNSVRPGVCNLWLQCNSMWFCNSFC